MRLPRNGGVDFNEVESRNGKTKTFGVGKIFGF